MGKLLSIILFSLFFLLLLLFASLIKKHKIKGTTMKGLFMRKVAILCGAAYGQNHLQNKFISFKTQTEWKDFQSHRLYVDVTASYTHSHTQKKKPSKHAQGDGFCSGQNSNRLSKTLPNIDIIQKPKSTTNDLCA